MIFQYSLLFLLSADRKEMFVLKEMCSQLFFSNRPECHFWTSKKKFIIQKKNTYLSVSPSSEAICLFHSVNSYGEKRATLYPFSIHILKINVNAIKLWCSYKQQTMADLENPIGPMTMFRDKSSQLTSTQCFWNCHWQP